MRMISIFMEEKMDVCFLWEAVMRTGGTVLVTDVFLVPIRCLAIVVC